ARTSPGWLSSFSQSSSCGDVNGWCIEYQRPSSLMYSSSGKSVTHRNSYCSGFSRFSFCAIWRRSAPSSLEVASAGPAAIRSRSEAAARVFVAALHGEAAHHAAVGDDLLEDAEFRLAEDLR